MEGTRIKIMLLMLCINTDFMSTTIDYRTGIYSAYVHNNMSEWKYLIDNMNEVKEKNNSFLLDLVNYQYGYIAWCIGKKKNDEAKVYLNMAEASLDVLSEDHKNLSLVNSYKAAFYGFRIGLNKMMVPVLGIKSIESARKAISIDPNNYFGYMQNGNIEFYMPAALGGSKNKALEYYLRAEKLIERNKWETKNNWNYLSLLASIAQCYYSINDFRSSMNYIEKILKIEPEFQLAKNVLYPMTLKKLQNQ